MIFRFAQSIVEFEIGVKQTITADFSANSFSLKIFSTQNSFG